MDFTTPWGPLNPRSPHPDLAAFRHTRFHTYHARYIPVVVLYTLLCVRILRIFPPRQILRPRSFGIDANFYAESIRRLHKAVIP